MKKDSDSENIIKPEKRKKVKFKSFAPKNIMNLVDSKAGKTVMAVVGFIAFVTLLATNPMLATTAFLGMAGLAGHEFKKGRKL